MFVLAMTAFDIDQGPTVPLNEPDGVSDLHTGIVGNRSRTSHDSCHHAGPRGGIETVEVLPARGSPEGDLVVPITNLGEAED